MLPFFEKVILYSDYYEKHTCKDVAENSRVAFLKDGSISIATQNYLRKWTFETQKCTKSY